MTFFDILLIDFISDETQNESLSYPMYKLLTPVGSCPIYNFFVSLSYNAIAYSPSIYFNIFFHPIFLYKYVIISQSDFVWDLYLYCVYNFL